MVLLDVPASAAMAAANMTISLAVMACRTVPILTDPSATRAILFAIPFTPVAIHVSYPPITVLKQYS